MDSALKYRVEMVIERAAIVAAKEALYFDDLSDALTIEDLAPLRSAIRRFLDAAEAHRNAAIAQD